MGKLSVRKLFEASFPWHKFDDPDKNKKPTGNPDPMGSKNRDVSKIGPGQGKTKKSSDSGSGTQPSASGKTFYSGGNDPKLDKTMKKELEDAIATQGMNLDDIEDVIEYGDGTWSATSDDGWFFFVHPDLDPGWHFEDDVDDPHVRDHFGMDP